MKDYQLNALGALSESEAWNVVKEEIFLPKIKDVTEPYNETIQKIIVSNPAAAYIGRLIAVAILTEMIDLVDSQRTREQGKVESWK